MVVGYIRCSTVEQNEGRQSTLLSQECEKVFVEKVSGRDRNREELNNMLEFVREGDTVVVESLSRLARSLKDTLDIIDLLEKKNVKFKSYKENIDTSTPSGKLMLSMMGAIYEYEIDCARLRALEGIKLAKEAGKYKGRQEIKKPKEWNIYYNKWKNREIKSSEIMKELKITKHCFYKWIKEMD